MSFFGAENAWITPSIAIAILALFFTVGSFWWIQVRRGRLIVYPPSTYTGSFGEGKLVLILPLIFYNPAPAPIVVLGLRLKIDAGRAAVRDEDLRVEATGENDDRKALPAWIYWNATLSGLYVSVGSGGSRVFASPFAVDGRKASEKFIEFQWNPPKTALENGPYSITVEVRTAHRKRWQRAGTFPLHTQFTTTDRRSMLVRPNDPDWQP